MADKSQHRKNEKKKPMLTLKERRAKKHEKHQQKHGGHFGDEHVVSSGNPPIL